MAVAGSTGRAQGSAGKQGKLLKTKGQVQEQHEGHRNKYTGMVTSGSYLESVVT